MKINMIILCSLFFQITHSWADTQTVPTECRAGGTRDTALIHTAGLLLTTFEQRGCNDEVVLNILRHPTYGPTNVNPTERTALYSQSQRVRINLEFQKCGIELGRIGDRCTTQVAHWNSKSHLNKLAAKSILRIKSKVAGPPPEGHSPDEFPSDEYSDIKEQGHFDLKTGTAYIFIQSLLRSSTWPTPVHESVSRLLQRELNAVEAARIETNRKLRELRNDAVATFEAGYPNRVDYFKSIEELIDILIEIGFPDQSQTIVENLFEYYIRYYYAAQGHHKLIKRAFKALFPDKQLPIAPQQPQE